MALIPYTVQKTLSPAGLRAAARQSEGMLRIPTRLQAAIETFLGEYSTHELKQSVSRLSEGMRNTKVALQQLEDSERSVEDDTWSRNSQKWQKKLHFRGQIFNKYRQRDTCAYVAARMPAVYSAVYRVLFEVSRRLPDFKPHQILDYGSGPGTAIWALCELWPKEIEHANIVEPSEAMSFARRSLFQAMKDQLPKIKNFKSFDGFVREVRPAEREHNLVIASYSLGELHTREEQISVARQLWGLTTDILVIIEPGHPRGSSIVREIRSHILCMENKRLWRQTKKHNVPEGEEPVCLTEQGKKAGAFVVAPCAHDGICPMDGTEKYCHFSQRLARSSSQLLFKRPKGRSLRGYEDEKFSFVILRRGSRPRMEWPLDRVDPSSFEENKKKNPSFYGVIVEEPEGFDDEDSEETGASSDDSEEMGEEGIEEECKEEMDEGREEKSESEVEGTEGASEDSSSDIELAEGSSNEEGGESQELKEEEEEDTDEPVADMGSGWGRILFHPVRRGKRVIIDVCCSANRNGTKGMLDRITLSSTTSRVLHFQARRSRWGDLWPCGDVK